MLILQNLTYLHPDKSLLFDNINLVVNRNDKIALIGNNGVGKSTLLKIMAGGLQPASGLVKTASKPYYIPQIVGQFNEYTVAEALQVDVKLSALREVLDGRVTEQNLALLGDDWTIEERCREALDHWKLDKIVLSQQMKTLSGGQKTKVFLGGILIHQPAIVLLDEPGNHLDSAGRKLLHQYVRSTTNTLVIVSHERA